VVWKSIEKVIDEIGNTVGNDVKKRKIFTVHEFNLILGAVNRDFAISRREGHFCAAILTSINQYNVNNFRVRTIEQNHDHRKWGFRREEKEM
jgi:hypothetical protein